MKISSLLFLFLISLFFNKLLLAQTDELKFYSKMDQMYSDLLRADKRKLPAAEYASCFDKVDRAAKAMIDSLPTKDLKEKATLVSYKNVLNTLGRYVDETDQALKKKLDKRVKGLNMKSPYVDQLPYIQEANLYGLYMTRLKMGLSIFVRASYVLKNSKSDNFHREYVIPILRSGMAYYGYSDSVRVLLKEVKLYARDSQLLAFTDAVEAKGEALSKGKPAPDFNMMDENGKTYRLSDFRGKYVLMDIWSTTCGPCVKAMPDLIETADRYKRYENIVIMSLALNPGQEGWVKFMKNKEFFGKMTNMRCTDNASKFMDDYAVWVLLRYVLIDPEGNIVDAWHISPSKEEFTEIFNKEVGIKS